MKEFCKIKVSDGKSYYSDIHIINDLLHQGQKKISFEDLKQYVLYKKNINFLKRKFKKLGYVPSFYIEYGTFHVIKAIRFTHRGRLCEDIAAIPLCYAYNRFNQFKIESNE